jgi:hypothetical protein
MLLLLTVSILHGQPPPELQKAWKEVKLSMDRKNKVITDLIPIIKQGQSADWKLLEEIRIVHDYFTLRYPSGEVRLWS